MLVPLIIATCFQSTPMPADHKVCTLNQLAQELSVSLKVSPQIADMNLLVTGPYRTSKNVADLLSLKVSSGLPTLFRSESDQNHLREVSHKFRREALERIIDTPPYFYKSFEQPMTLAQLKQQYLDDDAWQKSARANPHPDQMAIMRHRDPIDDEPCMAFAGQAVRELSPGGLADLEPGRWWTYSTQTVGQQQPFEPTFDFNGTEIAADVHQWKTDIVPTLPPLSQTQLMFQQRTSTAPTAKVDFRVQTSWDSIYLNCGCFDKDGKQVDEGFATLPIRGQESPVPKELIGNSIKIGSSSELAEHLRLFFNPLTVFPFAVGSGENIPYSLDDLLNATKTDPMEDLVGPAIRDLGAALGAHEYDCAFSDDCLDAVLSSLYAGKGALKLDTFWTALSTKYNIQVTNGVLKMSPKDELMAEACTVPRDSLVKLAVFASSPSQAGFQTLADAFNEAGMHPLYTKLFYYASNKCWSYDKQKGLIGSMPNYDERMSVLSLLARLKKASGIKGSDNEALQFEYNPEGTLDKQAIAICLLTGRYNDAQGRQELYDLPGFLPGVGRVTLPAGFSQVKTNAYFFTMSDKTLEPLPEISDGFWKFSDLAGAIAGQQKTPQTAKYVKETVIQIRGQVTGANGLVLELGYDIVLPGQTEVGFSDLPPHRAKDLDLVFHSKVPDDLPITRR